VSMAASVVAADEANNRFGVPGPVDTANGEPPIGPRCAVWRSRQHGSDAPLNVPSSRVPDTTGTTTRPMPAVNVGCKPLQPQLDADRYSSAAVFDRRSGAVFCAEVRSLACERWAASIRETDVDA
jgi:hypothetical protein